MKRETESTIAPSLPPSLPPSASVLHCPLPPSFDLSLRFSFCRSAVRPSVAALFNFNLAPLFPPRPPSAHYSVVKVDVTPEMEKWAALTRVARSAHSSTSSVTSTLSTLYAWIGFVSGRRRCQNVSRDDDRGQNVRRAREGPREGGRTFHPRHAALLSVGVRWTTKGASDSAESKDSRQVIVYW